MPGYWGGVVEGFQARREQQYQENAAREAQNRQLADRVFSHLLASRDPQMQELALGGLMAPLGGRKPGARGFMGEVESSGDPRLAAIVERMNALVPVEEEAGPPQRATQPQPALASGSAAMSTNQMTRPGSAPPAMPGQALALEPPPAGDTMSGAVAEMPPDLEPMGPQAQGAMLAPPPPKPESRWRRLGTGIPDARQIAEENARIPLQARMNLAQQYLGEDDARKAIMGILGAPQGNRQFAAPTFAVEDPQTNQPVPVSFDYTTGRFFFTDGSPVPRGARFVKMAGGASGGALTSKIPDSPEGKQYLIAQGADPNEVNAGSPTGYWKVVTRADGTIGVQPDMYTPPPALSGTTQILDAQGNAVVAGVTRGGQLGPTLGTAPNPQPSVDQESARALLAQVQDQIKRAEMPRIAGGIRRLQTPSQIDQLVRQAAMAAGLPYQTYFDLEQAARIPTARQQTPRQNAPAGPAPSQPPVSTADKIRELMLQNRRGGGAPPPQAPPPSSPAMRSNRGNGSAPRSLDGMP